MPLTPWFSPRRLAPLSRTLCLLALCAGGACAGPAADGTRPAAAAPPAAATAQTMPNEKESRTPAQRKIDSQLLYALYERRGERARRGTPKSDVEVDERGRVHVDVRARVTEELLAEVGRLGGEVESSSEQYNTIITRFPLEQLEALAAREDVHFISPVAKATTN